MVPSIETIAETALLQVVADILIKPGPITDIDLQELTEINNELKRRTENAPYQNIHN